MKYTHFSKYKNNYINTIFILFIGFYLFLGLLLILNIPYTFPYGGPDEPMHISMVTYLSNHFSWPHWNSTELLRSPYGASYSTGSSIVYWLHSVTYDLFHHHRIGSFLLLVIYLLITIILFIRNTTAGFFLLAGLLPQTIFVFSYVNADVGIIMTALFFGLSVAYFYSSAMKIKPFLLLFFFAGLTITSRQSLWPLSFITLITILLLKRSIVFKYTIRKWILAIFIGLVPASWWFITSFFANDGDIFGIFANTKSILEFSRPNLPSLAKGWPDFNIIAFLDSTFKSLYATWGWMNLQLNTFDYYIATLVTIFISIKVISIIDKKLIYLFINLIIVNIALMLVYSIYYDYQPQGRYLFPSVYIIIGIIGGILVTKKIHSNMLVFALIIFIVSNIYFSSKLTYANYIPYFNIKPVISNQHPIDYYKNANFHIDNFKANQNKLTISGWVYDQSSLKPFKKTSLLLMGTDQRYSIDLKLIERKDVANAFNNQSLVDTGFSVYSIALNTMLPGKYRIFLVVRKDDKDLYININKTIIVNNKK